MDPTWYHGSQGWLFPFGGFLFLLVVGIVILGTFLVLRTRRPPTDRTDALALLDARLARGEIDEEEYAHLKEVLR